MLVKELKELDQITIIYSEGDKKELDKKLHQLKNEYYIFSSDANKCYQLRKRKTPKIERRKNSEKNKYPGVFCKKSRWIAQISINNKNKYLGSFDSEEEANAYRNAYIKEHNLKR